jgi:hypothetical protein
MVDIAAIKDKVFRFVERNGPVLPVHISKEIGNDSLFAGAVLSDLVRDKKVLVSHSKIGGSPIYYVTSQKPKVEMLYKHLNEKERKMFDLLKSKKVLKDTLMEPWQRVAVREISDFSVKLTVASTGDIFWKWYDMTNQDAEELIKNILSEEKAEGEPVRKEPEISVKRGVPVAEKRQENELSQKTLGVEAPAKADVKKQKRDAGIKAGEVKQERELGRIAEKEGGKEEKREAAARAGEGKKRGRVKGLEKEAEKKRVLEESAGFLNSWLAGIGAEIVEEEVVRKGKDIEAIVRMQSSVGAVPLFVKFKDKKKLNDADLSLAQTKARARNASLLIVGTGELTKKAEAYAEKHNILFRTIRL